MEEELSEFKLEEKSNIEENVIQSLRHDNDKLEIKQEYEKMEQSNPLEIKQEAKMEVVDESTVILHYSGPFCEKRSTTEVWASIFSAKTCQTLGIVF